MGFFINHSLHYEKFPDGTVKCIEDEIPFELPEGWEWTRIFSVSFNLPYGTAKKSDSNGKVAVLRMGNLQNGEIDYSDLVYSSDDEDINQYELLENDLLFNRTNSAEWVGKTAIYRGGVKAIYAGYLIRLRTGLNAEYLNAVMNSQYERDYCNMVKTDGVNQSNINAQKLGAFLIPVPSISEQCRIVCKFNNLLSFIETIESDKTDLQTTIQLTKSKILDLAIRGKLVPQNPDDEPASVLLDRIRAEKEELIKQGKIKRDKKESVIFKGDDNSYYEKVGDTVTCIDEELPVDLPDGWTWVRLQSICEPITDGTHKTPVYSNSGYIFLSSKNVTSGKIDWDNVMYIPEELHEELYSRLQPKKNDILLAKNGTTGVSAIVDKDCVFDIYVSLALIRIVGYMIIPKYLTCMMGSKFVQDYFNSSLKGIGVPNLHLEHIRTALIPIAPLHEQEKIADSVQKYIGILEDIEKSLS